MSNAHHPVVITRVPDTPVLRTRCDQEFFNGLLQSELEIYGHRTTMATMKTHLKFMEAKGSCTQS